LTYDKDEDEDEGKVGKSQVETCGVKEKHMSLIAARLVDCAEFSQETSSN